MSRKSVRIDLIDVVRNVGKLSGSIWFRDSLGGLEAEHQVASAGCDSFLNRW